MMPNYDMRLMRDEPILFSNIYPDWDAGSEMEAYMTDFLEIIDTAGQPVYFVADLRDWSFTMPQIVQAANAAAGQADAMLHHPYMSELIVITQDTAIELAAQGLRSDLFGNVPVKIFDDLSNAMAYTRQRITNSEAISGEAAR